MRKKRRDLYPNNTIKFSIGIAECWGGCVSYKTITHESRFLSLFHGYVVHVDRGFTIAIRDVKLQIPIFTRGKNYLTQEEVETSKEHV